MPQNAIIRADGTGDYTSLFAWEAAEQGSNYGSRTIGRVDGFFDNGSTQFDLSGWPNGLGLEPFDPNDGFDGTERKLCGMTSTASITFRTRAIDYKITGLEIYNTGTGVAVWSTSTPTGIDAEDCLFKSENANDAVVPSSSITPGYTNCVLVAPRGYRAPVNLNKCSIFANSTSTVGTSSSAGIINDSVTVNELTGICYRPTITQSNNAATDSTADSFDNIVVGDEFESSTPLTSGDYRIKSGGTLATNGVGAFIQGGGGGLSIIGKTSTFTYQSINGGVQLTGQIDITGQTSTYVYNSIDGSVNLTGNIEISGLTSTYQYQSVDGNVNLTGDLLIQGQTSSYVYQSVNASVTLTGNIEVIGSISNVNYQAINATVEIGSQLNIIGQTSTFNYQSIDATVTLQGDIDIVGQTSNYNFQSVNATIRLSSGRQINVSNVMVSYADDGIQASYADDSIQINYADDGINIFYG